MYKNLAFFSLFYKFHTSNFSPFHVLISFQPTLDVRIEFR